MTVVRDQSVRRRFGAPLARFELNPNRAIPRVIAQCDLGGEDPAQSLAIIGHQSIRPTAKVSEALPRKAGHLGIICDLDQTVIPPHDRPPMPDPFPGIRELLRMLGEDNTHYVTGRSPELAAHVPAYLKHHGFPMKGTLNTGWPGATDAKTAARKFAQISSILMKDPTRSFVLFGDSSHVDAEVYRRVLQKFPGRIVAAFIRQVPEGEPIEAFGGLTLIHNYAQAAQALEDLDVIDKEQADQIAHVSIA